MVGYSFGGGIWGSGGGLLADRNGRIFFTTGNASGATDDTPQAGPTQQLSQSAVRLQVQNDGSLLAVDFFAPYNRAMLDLVDADFGSGGPVGLPSAYFGTPATPNLRIAGGMRGRAYLRARRPPAGFN